jgi:hypothetical protein
MVCEQVDPSLTVTWNVAGEHAYGFNEVLSASVERQPVLSASQC